MRPPPPLRDAHRYPVVSGVAILSIGVTLAWWAKVDVSAFFETAMIRRGELWRLVTSILPHVDVLHLIFNVYWLWVFGSIVEQVYGHFKTAALILLFAVGSGAMEFAFADGGVGLSGVGYGLFGLLWILSLSDPRFQDAVDRKTIELFVFWFGLCIVTTVTKIMPVANIAHGAGALLGVLTGVAITQPRRRIPAWAGVVATVVFGFWGSTLGRPEVNLSADSGHEEGQWGYEDLMAGKNQEALRWLMDAVKYRSKEPTRWYNLGIAYDRLKNETAAIEAMRKAAALGHAGAADLVADAYAGGTKGLPEDDSQAVYWYRKAAELGNADAAYDLALRYATGSGGVARDAKQANDWLRRATATDDAWVLNSAAWVYATSEDPAIRNPALALKFAQKAVSLAKGESAPNYLDTLAAAYYANSKFSEAIKTEQQAVKALAGRDPKDFEERLDFYRKALRRGVRREAP